MKAKKVKIKVYSDRKEVSVVTRIVKQIDIKEASIVCQTPRNFEIEGNDIIILLIENSYSNFINNIIEQKKSINNLFIVITQNNSALLITSLIKMGFKDIFLFPYEIPKFISHLTEIINNNTYMNEVVNETNSDLQNFNPMVGTSKEFSRIIEIAKKVSANRSVNVLILGETGTGKGLLAKAIHNNSKNANTPFVEVICSAIPEDLLESELFGHEKGAFTNALYKKPGLFELAENGTLFLDEIGDLSFNLQVKLLRVIEKKIIRRLGGVEDIPVNTRIISATNRDLNDMVEKSLFRKDLFHRLNVVSILMPPLKERGKDVVLLMNKFVVEFNKEFNRSVNKFEDGLEEFLLSYPWPGNIRELKNAVERAVLLNEDNMLKLNDFTILLKNLPLNLINEEKHILFHPNLIRLDLNYEKVDLVKLSHLYAAEILKKTGGNKTKSSKILGISRPKLDKLLKNKL